MDAQFFNEIAFQQQVEDEVRDMLLKDQKFTGEAESPVKVSKVKPALMRRQSSTYRAARDEAHSTMARMMLM